MDPVVSLKRCLSLDYSLCIFCQTHKSNVPTSTASDHGLTTVKAAACSRRKRRDVNNQDAIDRLQNVLGSAAVNIVWHKMCYAHFTDKSKIERLRVTEPANLRDEAGCSDIPAAVANKGPSLRKHVQPVKWKECIFCQEDRKERLYSVMNKPLSDRILQASQLDYNLDIRLAGVIDLIAAEAKYHLKCLSSFTRSTSKTKQEYSKTDLAMTWLHQELLVAAGKGSVLVLADVWERYKELADESSITIPQSYYSRSTTFKEKLQSQIGNLFTFFQPLDKCPSDRKILLIPTKYQPVAVVQMKDNSDDAKEMLKLPKYEPHDDMLSIIHVALKIHGDMMSAPGHQGLSVSEDDAISCIPDSLYMLLRVIFGGQECLDDENAHNGELDVRRKVLSIAQDLVYCVSEGKKWTPKHIGLASTLHQATRSKDLVMLFNKAGHCLSYEQVLQVDTSLAESTLKSVDEASGAVIPPNITANKFIHYTCDNIDILDETLDGKNTFHATQMAVWQRGETVDATMNMLKPSTRRTLVVPSILQKLHHTNITPSTCEPVFTTPVDIDWFNNCTVDIESLKCAEATDLAFYLSRQDSDSRLSWTAFNKSISSQNRDQTAAGYLPIILAPAHELDTLNTAVRRCMAISSHFGQEYTVITVDQALYCKLMELKWSIPEYQDKLIPRLGGLHISMNFLRAIGDHMEGSGLADIWLESEILGQGAVQLVLSGKAYNKGMRAHKLTIQALWRILVPKFLSYVADEEKTCHAELTEVMADDKSERIQELISLLMQERFRKLMIDYVESKSDDVNLTFWWQYMDMVSILLQFTRAMRDGIWDLHLQSFKRMLPYFKRYDHLNYAKWGPIYLADMHQLPAAVESEFQKGNFVVKGSNETFNQVDPDQAMEWINGTGKKDGGIIGITKTTSALYRWTLSYNLRTHIAENTKKMFNLSRGSPHKHNEATKSRQKRDNDDENVLLSTFQRFNVFSTVAHTTLLQNIATKDIATDSIQYSLLHAKELGQKEVINYVRNLVIIKPNISFRARTSKVNAPTFRCLYEVVKESKDKVQKVILKADRNVLQRLITAYEAGRPVDLPSVLKHELLPVPLSLTEMNGTLRTGNKSAIADILTEGIHCPETIVLHETSSCLIIDGQALVVALGKPEHAKTFGDLADTYVRSVMKSGHGFQRIDVVFDRYREDTIKGTTRKRRGKFTRPIRRVIEDRNVPLPNDWKNFLSLSENKSDLANFLSTELCLQAPDDKNIVVAGGFMDELEVWSSKGTLTDINALKSTQEEADTRLVLHAVNNQCRTVVVSSRDTDVLLLLVAHFERAQCEHLWMMAGTSKKQRYIPVCDVFNKLPTGSFKSLLPFHALTGCDTTSFFANHTKRSSWKVFKQHHDLLKNLGIGELTQDTIQSAETFVCRIYNVHSSDSVDSARHILFSRTGKAEEMSPTSDALRFHLMRVHYQAMVWRNAHCAIPNLPDPVRNGWKRDDVGLKPILMSSTPIPDGCLDVISCKCNKQCVNLRCKCRKSDMKCTSMCACHHQKHYMDRTPCMNVT